MIQEENIEKIIQLDIEIEGLTEEELEEFGVEMVSLVDEPAIGVDFMAFASEEGEEETTEIPHSNQKFSLNEDERIISGPLMIPNKFILRRDEDGSPYYIFFTKATIKKMMERFLKLNKHNNTDIQHDNQITTKNTLLESWISEDKMYDKAYKLGFALPIGTWYVSYKINDEETWDKIKLGELKGFSLAGPFIEKMASENVYHSKLQDVINILNQIDDE